MHTLDTLHFDNGFAGLPEDFYSRVTPTPLNQPHLVSFNPAAAALIGLSPDQAGRADFAEYFTGNRLLPGSDPLAMLYSGHQFGHYVPQLGDGRAILLGEVRGPDGRGWELQLKGAGRTPYSRDGDGRAVLRSTIREYLCSEAMHGLGIPTTRALCITGSKDEVYRESIESAAVLLRMAPTHIRFGSFEVFFYRDRHDQLKILADYVIDRYYPDFSGMDDRHALLLDAVVRRTATLMAQWQAVGFAHGVMNTDNMSILGLTLDYGPYGFLDSYDPGFICNHSDHHGRYAFDQQPEIGLWNCTCLAQALSPLISVERCREILGEYQSQFMAAYAERIRRKVGLRALAAGDADLLNGLFDILKDNRVDYTRFFRALCQFDTQRDIPQPNLRDQFLEREAFDRWARDYRARLISEQSDDSQRQAQMRAVNPKYILRNYLAQIAIDKASRECDYSEIDRLLAVLQHPFDEHPVSEHYAALPPDWAEEISVSCSS